MPDHPGDSPADADQDPQRGPAAPPAPHPQPDGPVAGDPAAQVAVRPPAHLPTTPLPAREPAAVVWRRRALAVRTSLPELARNPVVVGASTVVATVAARAAVEVVRRALGAPPAPRAGTLSVTGRMVHHVHVTHHVLVTRTTDPVALLRLTAAPPARRSPAPGPDRP